MSPPVPPSIRPSVPPTFRPPILPPALCCSAFTLIELLVVMAVLGLLSALLMPALGRGREAARSAQCMSNLRQLQTANALYADHRGNYVPAAVDLMSTQRQRWHGARTAANQPFDPARGPLVPFLGSLARIRRCASLQAEPGFEAGCGGYGYNDRGVGSRAYQLGYNEEAMDGGMRPDDLADPAATVMFTDAAFPQRVRGKTHLIEYSFAEAYFHLSSSLPVQEDQPASPTIHFRHHGRANVAWCDGHVSAETMTRSAGAVFKQCEIGWFGGPDNRLFDPF